MSRRRKRLLWALGICLIVVGVPLLSLLVLLKLSPSYYQAIEFTPEQRDEITRRLEDRLGELSNTIGRPVVLSASTKPVRRYTITFTEDELNVGYQKWSTWYDVASRISMFVRDPQIRLRPDEIVIAGRVSQVDSVLSLHFRTDRAETGESTIRMDDIRAGILPVPDRLLEGPRRRLLEALRRNQPRWQQQSRLTPPNDMAANFLMGQAITRLLNGEEVGGDMVLKGSSGWVAARLESLKVEHKSVTATFRLLETPEQFELEQRIKSTQ